MTQLTKLMLVFALLYNISAFSKSTDNEAPLNIEADQLEIREKDSISIYNGHVKITKGTMKISGDRIVIKNKDGRLYKIHINGTPATFYQFNDLYEVISAESHIMDYKAKTGLLELKEKALLLKNKNRFSSEHIIYNTLEDIVKAGNHNVPDSQETPRVKITIHPEPQNSEPAK